MPVPIPHFDCIVGNPPYLRSQNQDDLDPNYRQQLFGSAIRVGINAKAKTDLFAFFIYHAIRFMREGSRLGFVTPASWLTSDYAVSLQNLVLRDLRLVAIISSNAESFFPQVDVNAVLLVVERAKPTSKKNVDANAVLRFVSLKKPIRHIVNAKKGYWDSVVSLADSILDRNSSFEDANLRVKVVSLLAERSALGNDPSQPRNWSKYLRAPLTYYELFGEIA